MMMTTKRMLGGGGGGVAGGLFRPLWSHFLGFRRRREKFVQCASRICTQWWWNCRWRVDSSTYFTLCLWLATFMTTNIWPEKSCSMQMVFLQRCKSLQDIRGYYSCKRRRQIFHWHKICRAINSENTKPLMFCSYWPEKLYSWADMNLLRLVWFTDM